MRPWMVAEIHQAAVRHSQSDWQGRPGQCFNYLADGVKLAPPAPGGISEMKTKLLTLLLLVGSSMFAQSRFSIQVDIGTPAYDARLHPR
jgi:hypothetical protein